MSEGEAKVQRAIGVVVRVVLAGLALCALLSVLSVLFMPTLLHSKETANQRKCANDLRWIGLAALQYCDDRRNLPHVRARAALDGDVHTPDTPRAMRLLVAGGYLDGPEALVCPSSRDAVAPTTGKAGRTWTWGGGVAAHPPLDPLALDPALDATTELSYGWTRRGLDRDVSATTPLAADRAVVEDPDDAGPLRGNHRDGWTVLLADGSVRWHGVAEEPFPGAWLTATDGERAGALALKVQGDPAAFR